MIKKDEILKIVADTLEQKPSSVDLNQTLEDELDKQNLLMAIEDALGLEFTSEEADGILKISDIIKTLESRHTQNDQMDPTTKKPIDFKALDFSSALSDAEAELQKEYYNTVGEKILFLCNFKSSPYERDVENFLNKSFSTLKSVALRKVDSGDIVLINTVAFSALVNLVGKWGNSNFIPLMIEEFQYCTLMDREPVDRIKRHYELMIISGDIAITLARLGYSGSFDFMKSFLEWCERRYTTSDFLLKIFYLKWVKTNDANAAIAYLEKESSGASFAIAALSDMNHKNGAVLIEEKMNSSDNLIFKEICQEALDRLGYQNSSPGPEALFVNLFGDKTSTELALGAETDNEFIVRAKRKSLDSEIGIVTETDDSNFDD